MHWEELLKLLWHVAEYTSDIHYSYLLICNY